MARTKGAVNTSTMIKEIRAAGRYVAGLEDRPREEIKNIYESVLRNAGVVPVAKGTPAPAPLKPQSPPLTPKQESGTKVPSEAGQVAAPTTKPPEPQSEFAKRVEARRAEASARLAKAREAAAHVVRVPPPLDPSTIVDTTSVEGKTVAEWDAIVEQRRNTTPPSESDILILDLTDMSGWATWAVDQWNRRGRPTVREKALAEIRELQDKASEQEGFAQLDENEARKADEAREKVKAQKKRDQAEKKKQKALEYRKRAEEIAALHSIKLTAA